MTAATVIKMTEKQLAARVPCQRCGRRKNAGTLHCLRDRGVVVGLVCEACQTAKEHRDAEWLAGLVAGMAAWVGRPPVVTVAISALFEGVAR